MFGSIIAMTATAIVFLGLFAGSIVFGIKAFPFVLLAVLATLFWINKSAPTGEDAVGEEAHLTH